MKHSIGMKAIAIILAALFLSLAACGLLGGVVAMEEGFYSTDSFENWQKQQYEQYAATLASVAAEEYVQRELSTCPEEIRWQIGGYDSTIEETASWYGISPENLAYRIESEDGTLLESGGTIGIRGVTYTETCTSWYWMQVTQAEDHNMIFEVDDEPVFLRKVESDPLIVTVWLADGAVTSRDGAKLIPILFQYRYVIWGLTAVSTVLFVLCVVYLCFAAGKKRTGDTPMPGGLNRLPLDLYLCVGWAGGAALVAMTCWTAEAALNSQKVYTQMFRNILLTLAGVGVYGTALLVAGFLFALAAQVKSRIWWSNSLLGRLWKLIGRGIRWVSRGVRKLIGLLPLMWRWLLIAALMVVIPLLCLFLACAVHWSVAELFWILLFLASIAADIAMVCYGAYAFGVLLGGVRRLAQGELEGKIDTRYLRGTFLSFAQSLNALADVAVVAAKKQMRSERMKTELITNVSHDIKTPLTSIINYVDLLEKPHTPQQQEQYLEVLGRQSQRLKKLIEDLMEMSKATTGNLAVEIGKLDGAEAVNQALGEFSDKLAQAQLVPVFRQPETPVMLLADGRLTWRVLSNLLSNIVKYALPGTRVYIDMTETRDCVLISLKNISREELNISAEELTERFVRGDASRNTEGSGLGLNIAKSLMELQKGQLQLLVDGDLFKVTLTFPKA